MINVLTERETMMGKIKGGVISKYILASIKIIKMDSLALKIKYVNLGNQWKTVLGN